MLKCAARCKVVVTLLELLARLESTTEVELILAASCLVLSETTPVPSAAFPKFPVMVMVCGLEAVGNVVRAKLRPAGSQVVTPTEHTTPVTLNPAGNVFATVTLV